MNVPHARAAVRWMAALPAGFAFALTARGSIVVGVWGGTCCATCRSARCRCMRLKRASCGFTCSRATARVEGASRCAAGGGVIKHVLRLPPTPCPALIIKPPLLPSHSISSFYERMGLEVVARKEDYPAPGRTAIRMAKLVCARS